MDELQEKIRILERENSEMKAAKLMSMFNTNGGTQSAISGAFGLGSSKQSINALERQIESLKV